MSKKPRVAITLGDPSGIGSEIVLKALGRPHIYEQCRPLVIGSIEILRAAADTLRSNVLLQPVLKVSEMRSVVGTVDVWDIPADAARVQVGVEGAESGRLAFEAVRTAVELAMRGQVDVIATAPLNKAALHLAGFHYAGHTEILADLTHTRDFAMLLVTPELRVIHVSTHVSLREAIARVQAERILKVIEIADRALRRLDIAQPRIAVAGLNPHSGEGGLFGREEIEHIAPAIQQAQAAGCNASGPHPPDTVFYRARQGEFDIVVAMYHDQGHIPIKLSGFESGVNVSLGMPFVRTSVDHGTAFDIAGKGVASEQSMVEAIELAARMASTSER